MENAKDTRKMLTVKMPRSMLDELAIVARLHGTTMSSMVFQFVMRTIREQKEATPEHFPDHKPIDRGIKMEYPPEVLEAFAAMYESFGGGGIDPETLRIAFATTQMLKEAEKRKAEAGKVVTIAPGKKKAG